MYLQNGTKIGQHFFIRNSDGSISPAFTRQDAQVLNLSHLRHHLQEPKDWTDFIHQCINFISNIPNIRVDRRSLQRCLAVVCSIDFREKVRIQRRQKKLHTPKERGTELSLQN